MVFIVVIMMWVVATSVSSMKYKEESFAHYSMYRSVKEQHQNLMEKNRSRAQKEYRIVLGENKQCFFIVAPFFHKLLLVLPP